MLLVDDEALVRASTAHLLGDLDFTVMEAGSAAEALARLRDLHPDLLFIDHLMPGMTGTELTRQLERPHLRTLIVSSCAEVDDIAPEFPRLAKPFRSEELLANLAAMGLSP